MKVQVYNWYNTCQKCILYFDRQNQLCCVIVVMYKLTNTFHNLIDEEKDDGWLDDEGYEYFLPHILRVGKQGR